MSGTQVLAPHDDGRLWVAEVLDQFRSREDGTWRVVVTYSTGPGETYIRAEPAARCRAVDDPPTGWTDPRQEAGRTAPRITPVGTGTRPDHPVV